MSDRGVLTHQYQRTSDLAMQLEQFLTDGAGWAWPVAGTTRPLPVVLTSLARMVAPEQGAPDPAVVQDVPARVVRVLRQRRREGTEPDRALDLLRAAGHIEDGQPLDEPDREALTWLSRELESEAAVVYRRLVDAR